MEKIEIPSEGHSFLRKSVKGKHYYLFAAFAVPVLIFLAAYFLFGGYPIRGESVLVLDLNAQYVYFFGALRRAIFGDTSLIYSFSRAMGGEFIGIFAYYLASPLSFIVALFPEDMILDALLCMFAIKTGLCSVSLSYYLEKRRIGTKCTRIIFGTLYALCGYGVIYQHNTMWIDCMIALPLVAAGIEKLISEKKYLLFTLSLGIAIFSNFYIGYMMCIFCAIYFFYAYFCIDKNPAKEKLHFVKSLSRMAVFSAIAVAMAAVIILPTYYSLQFGKTTFSKPAYSFTPRFDILDLVSKLFLNSYDTVRPDGLPVIYCGILTLLLLPLFFISKRVPLREKVGSGVVIGIFFASFSIDAIDKFWHGMQAPNWLNYRYSFMLVFILIVAAARALGGITKIEPSKIAISVFGWLIVLFAAQKLCIDNMHKSDLNRDLLCIWLSVLFFVIFGAVISLYRNKRYKFAATSVLMVVLCAELLISGITSICYLDDDVVYSTRASYLDNKRRYEDSVDHILESDRDFYRFDKTAHALINTPMSLGIRGFTNSTSTLNRETIDFLRYMGLASKSHWSKYLGATPVFDSFLGVRYVISDGEYAVPETYSVYYEGKNTVVYKNPNALSIAYAVSDGIKDFKLNNAADAEAEGGEDVVVLRTPPARMNALAAAMLGTDKTDIFVPIKSDSSEFNLDYSYIAEHAKYTPKSTNTDSYITYTLTAPASGVIYMYIPSDYPRELAVSVNSMSHGTVLGNESDRMISIGTFKKGDFIKVKLTLKDNNAYIRADEPYFWYVDTGAYLDTFGKLATEQFIIDSWSETCFKGSINVSEEAKTVFTSIPYDKNWKVYIDGSEVDTFKLLEATVGFNISAGEHTLVIKYVPRQLYMGLAISAFAICLLVIICIFDRRKKSKVSVTANDEASSDSADIAHNANLAESDGNTGIAEAEITDTDLLSSAADKGEALGTVNKSGMAEDTKILHEGDDN